MIIIISLVDDERWCCLFALFAINEENGKLMEFDLNHFFLFHFAL